MDFECGIDMEYCLKVKELYPNLIPGYDIVGQESLGRTTKDLTPVLLWFRQECTKRKLEIPFFFHAGECITYGDSTD